MTVNSWLQLGLFVLVLILLAAPLGAFMARIYGGEIPRWLRWMKPVENAIYKICGVRDDSEMNWKHYTAGILLFNLAGFCALYLLQRWQGFLPFNPQAFGAVSRDSAFNTAVSFVTNTNWQGYGGETTMSYFTQMLGLGVQNFLSAATGMAVVVALVRGLARRESDHIGNCWVDLTRSTLYILLPLSLILALVLVSQGVVQNLSPYKNATTLQRTLDASGKSTFTQQIALGPVASQESIKELGTNGGGFFNANSAHPFENPTPLSNFLEMLAILLIPAALCFTFGIMVRDKKQGWALLAAMTVVFVAFTICCIAAEQSGNPRLANVDKSTLIQPGGNMEGKETRFGIADSGLFAAVTTAASCGAVNAMHDSFTPLGGMMPLVLMQFSEVIFGGVGSGLYGMLIFAIVAVFVAGLMVGRTPEYLGKKIEAFEMKMASLILLLPCAVALLVTAIAISSPLGRATIFNGGAHGFSEVLYAATSTANNNGSAFAGLGANNPFYNILLAFSMLIPRFGIIIATLAIAGSLTRKKLVPVGPGTLPTTGVLFVGMLIGVVLIVGALTYIPALALGPVVEHLQMIR
jgi:K+-transporting ATPase ATPase A chain